MTRRLPHLDAAALEAFMQRRGVLAIGIAGADVAAALAMVETTGVEVALVDAELGGPLGVVERLIAIVVGGEVVAVVGADRPIAEVMDAVDGARARSHALLREAANVRNAAPALDDAAFGAALAGHYDSGGREVDWVRFGADGTCESRRIQSGFTGSQITAQRGEWRRIDGNTIEVTWNRLAYENDIGLHDRDRGDGAIPPYSYRLRLAWRGRLVCQVWSVAVDDDPSSPPRFPYSR